MFPSRNFKSIHKMAHDVVSSFASLWRISHFWVEFSPIFSCSIDLRAKPVKGWKEKTCGNFRKSTFPPPRKNRKELSSRKKKKSPNHPHVHPHVQPKNSGNHGTQDQFAYSLGPPYKPNITKSSTAHGPHDKRIWDAQTRSPILRMVMTQSKVAKRPWGVTGPRCKITPWCNGTPRKKESP